MEVSQIYRKIWCLSLNRKFKIVVQGGCFVGGVVAEEVVADVVRLEK
jgi:hypothetical protein